MQKRKVLWINYSITLIAIIICNLFSQNGEVLFSFVTKGALEEGIVKGLNKLTDNQKNIFWESILKYRLSSSSGLIKANKDYQNARAVYDAIDLVSSKPKFAFIAKKAEKTIIEATAKKHEEKRIEEKQSEK